MVAVPQANGEYICCWLSSRSERSQTAWSHSQSFSFPSVFLNISHCQSLFYFLKVKCISEVKNSLKVRFENIKMKCWILFFSIFSQIWNIHILFSSVHTWNFPCTIYFTNIFLKEKKRKRKRESYYLRLDWYRRENHL